MKDLFVEEAYYHVFNRANGNEDLFREDTNYKFFLERYFHYTQPLANTLAFCLLKNHFHILIRIKKLDLSHWNSVLKSNVQYDNPVNYIVANQFSRLFNSYAKAINKMYDRKGSLFQTNVKRKRVHNIQHLQTLVMYIHRNPEKDGITQKLQEWSYSSWHLYNESRPGSWMHFFKDYINCVEVIDWFGDKENFMQLHVGFEYQKIHSVFDVRNYGGLRG